MRQPKCRGFCLKTSSVCGVVPLEKGAADTHPIVPILSYTRFQLPCATTACSCQRSRTLPFQCLNALCSSAHLLLFPNLPSLPRGILHTHFLSSDLFCCCVLSVPASRQRADKQLFIHHLHDLYPCQHLQGFQSPHGLMAATRRLCTFRLSLTSVQHAPEM